MCGAGPIGVVLASAASGLGEVTFLALAAAYPRYGGTPWGWGTVWGWGMTWGWGGGLWGWGGCGAGG